MEATILLSKFGTFVAMFTGVSILTVGSLSLTNSLSSEAFKPGTGPGGFTHTSSAAGLLRDGIQTYVNKLFGLYLLAAFWLFFPFLLVWQPRHLADLYIQMER